MRACRALAAFASTALLFVGCGATPANPAQQASAATTSGPSEVAASPAPTRPPSQTPPARSAASPAAQLGGQIVFVDDPGSEGVHQIYLEHADGSDVHRLVTSAFNDVSPSFSPDGSRVVFSRELDPNPGHVFVVNADGSAVRQLNPGGCPKNRLCNDGVEGHAWSPDGKRIVFTRAIFDQSGPDGDYANVGLWVMNADGSAAHQLTRAGLNCPHACPNGAQDDEAGWSPDGLRIVFQRDTYTSPEQFGIFTIAADGSDLRRVTPVAMNVGDPDWSPDGTQIAFQSPPDPVGGVVQNIFVIGPDGTGLTQLTHQLNTTADGTSGAFHPSWSPDGREIVFSHFPSSANGSGDLFVMNRDGTGPRVIRVNDAQNENQPFWGPGPGA